MATITYNASENTIYADGGTESDPITLEDIYQAAVSGGWGVQTKHDSPAQNKGKPPTLYVFDCRLTMGKNATTYADIGPDKALWAQCFTFTGGGECAVTDGSVMASQDYKDGSGTNQSDFTGTNYLTAYRSAIWYDSNRQAGSANYERSFFHGGLRVKTANGQFTDYMHMNGYFYLNAGAPPLTRVTAEASRSSGETRVFRQPNILNRVSTWESSTRLIDPLNTNYSVVNAKDGYYISEEWTWTRTLYNDGALSGLDVTIEDGTDSQVASYTSNASGLPDSEILLLTRKWEDSDETLTDYNPFTVTIAENSDTYATLEMTYDVTAKQNEPIYIPTYDELGMPVGSVVKTGETYAQGTRTGSYAGPTAVSRSTDASGTRTVSHSLSGDNTIEHEVS